MDANNNIIAIRKRDITLAHEAFVDLMRRRKRKLKMQKNEQNAKEVSAVNK